MENNKEKVIISISLDKKLNNYMEDMFNNKSKYIEWLIYEDLKNSGVDLEKVIV